jgi:hypothetical protein
MGAILLAGPDGDDEAQHVRDCIRRTLRNEPGVLWLAVRRHAGKLCAQIRDITLREMDWAVDLSISAGTPDDELEARVRQALTLRIWDTAPPVTWRQH